MNQKLQTTSRVDLLEVISIHYSIIQNHLCRRVVDDNGCWNWTGSTKGSRARYGKVNFRLDGTRRCTGIMMHRLSYAYHYGVDPGELSVCHRCDNPLCFNPDHLFLGSHADNMRDMFNKGRAARQDGVNNSSRKATTADIDLVVSLIPKLNNKQIAARLDERISHGQVSRIRRGKSWAEYTGFEADSNPDIRKKPIRRTAQLFVRTEGISPNHQKRKGNERKY